MNRERDLVGEYVAELRAEVGRSGFRRRFVGEVEAHLQEAVAARIGAGVAPDRAASEAISSFGEPREVAAALEREVPARRWRRAAVAATGAAAAAAAILAVVSAPPPGTVSRDGARFGGRDAEAERVADVLRLSEQATDVLATAQLLGRRASSCLLRHGGRADSAGGIRDPSGQARVACLPLIEANDRYLNGSEFRQVLAEAQPMFEAAERCVAGIDERGDAAAGRVRQPTRPAPTAPGGPCHRRDGLPATA